MPTKTARRHNRDWTAHEVSHMRSCAKKKMSARQAAPLLGRSPGAVRYKAMVEGVHFRSINQPPGVQQRIARRNRRGARS